jgi:hypothetical protein
VIVSAFRSIAFALVASLLVVTGSAQAAPPTLDFVGQNAAQHLTADWTLAPGTETAFIEASKSPDLQPNGLFVTAHLIETPQPTAESYATNGKLDPGTYYVHVAVYDTATCPPTCTPQFSNVQSVEILDTGPPPPPTLVSAGSSSRFLTATWTLAPGAASGFIEAGTSPLTDLAGFFFDADTVLFAELDPGQTTYRSTVQLAPRVYYVHVSAYNPNQCAFGVCDDVFSSAVQVNVPPDPPPPPPPPPPVDKVTTFSVLKCASKQKIGNLVVQAAMPENGTITVSGTVNVPNTTKVYKLKSVSVTATAGKTVTVKLKLPRKALKAAKKALRRRKKVRASLTIAARDSAGNSKAEKRGVKLKR